MTEDSSEMLTSPSAARTAGLHRVHFARLIRDGKGPRYQTISSGGRHIVLIAKADLCDWLSKRSPRREKSWRVSMSRVRVVPGERWYVMGRDRETCVYCGWHQGSFAPGSGPRSIHVDHIVPFSRGGEPTRENLVCSCSRCNLYKGDRTPEEACMNLDHLQPRVEYICGCIFEVRLEGDAE